MIQKTQHNVTKEILASVAHLSPSRRCPFPQGCILSNLCSFSVFLMQTEANANIYSDCPLSSPKCNVGYTLFYAGVFHFFLFVEIIRELFQFVVVVLSCVVFYRRGNSILAVSQLWELGCLLINMPRQTPFESPPFCHFWNTYHLNV